MKLLSDPSEELGKNLREETNNGEWKENKSFFHDMSNQTHQRPRARLRFVIAIESNHIR